MNTGEAEISALRVEIERIQKDADDLDGSFTLITQERSQKFDLLLHLIANLRQPLLVCGPEGIGKTTILERIRDKRSQFWSLCLLRISRRLELLEIQQHLVASMGWNEGQKKASIHQILRQRLDWLASQKNFLVLLLDDAGQLAPGVFTELCQFVETSPAIRLVVSMTLDDYQIKEVTDPVINDCQLVEIPSLNEQQCGLYLRSLSGNPGTALSIKAVTPLFIEKVYKETHGIPGKIHSQLPRLSKKVSWRLNFSGARVQNILFWGLAIVLGAVFWVYLNAPSNDSASHAASNVVQKPIIEFPLEQGSQSENRAVEDKVPEPQELATATAQNRVPEADLVPEPDSAPPAPAHSTEAGGLSVLADSGLGIADSGETLMTESLLPKEPVAEPRAVSPFAESSDVSVEGEVDAAFSDPAMADKAPVSKETRASGPADNGEPEPLTKSETPIRTSEESQGIPRVAGAAWLKAQPPQHYTLQLLALSSEKSLIELVKKYPQLDNLAYFRSRRKKKDLFPLLYGSFPTRKQALAARDGLPTPLKESWLRRFASVQAEMNRTPN